MSKSFNGKVVIFQPEALYEEYKLLGNPGAFSRFLEQIIARNNIIVVAPYLDGESTCLILDNALCKTSLNSYQLERIKYIKENPLDLTVGGISSIIGYDLKHGDIINVILPFEGNIATIATHEVAYNILGIFSAYRALNFQKDRSHERELLEFLRPDPPIRKTSETDFIVFSFIDLERDRDFILYTARNNKDKKLVITHYFKEQENGLDSLIQSFNDERLRISIFNSCGLGIIYCINRVLQKYCGELVGKGKRGMDSSSVLVYSENGIVEGDARSVGCQFMSISEGKIRMATAERLARVESKGRFL